MSSSARSTAVLVLGPQQMPPQGAKALVRGLLRARDGGRPNVAAVLFEQHPGATELEFVNEGGETALELRYVLVGADGKTSAQIGNLPPGENVTTPVRPGGAVDPVRCVWFCRDAKGRLHVWSYEGRHKRLRRGASRSDEDCLRLMYG